MHNVIQMVCLLWKNGVVNILLFLLLQLNLHFSSISITDNFPGKNF